MPTTTQRAPRTRIATPQPGPAVHLSGDPKQECQNPFCVPPSPIPCDPYEWDGEDGNGEPWLDYNLFTPETIETVIQRNHAWLQARPREAYDVLRVLFPRYQKAGMTNDDILAVICHGLWEAGYKPSGERLDARWTFPA